MHDPFDSLPRAATGTGGLDFILGGGLARNRLHLLEGSQGAGKTIIALQFLVAGAETRAGAARRRGPRRRQRGADRRHDDELESKARDALSVPFASNVVRLRS